MNNEEDNEMDFDIKQILEEIKKYAEIPEQDILDFILQDRKGDMAFFYYKHMLLQLVEFDEHYLRLLKIYDREKEPETDLREHMHSFASGNPEKMREVIEFFRERSQIRKDWGMWFKLEELTQQWLELDRERSATTFDIDETREELEEPREELQQLNSQKLLDYLFSIRRTNNRRALLTTRMENGEEKCKQLAAKVTELNSQIETKIQEIRNWFECQNLQEIGERYIQDLATRREDILNEYRI